LSTVTRSTPVGLISENNHPAGSPLWWVVELERELQLRSTLICLFEDYYEGRHKLSFATSKYREQFGMMLAAVSDNWLPLIINAWVERLKPQGFSFGEENQEGDKDAWRIWQANFLDADCKLGFREAGKHGESYLLIWPDEHPTGTFGKLFARRSDKAPPRITLEHPSQVVVRRAAGDRRRRAAALKKWREDDGTQMATLYLPDTIHRFQRNSAGSWVPRSGVEGESRHGLGVVPVVPLVNDPHMLPCRPPMALCVPPHGVDPTAFIGFGRSDLADFITSVDQINKLICDMMIASEFAGFRQRWATGLEVPTDEETGEPVQQFEAAVDRIWATASDGAKFGDFEATELKNYGDAIEGRIRSLGARSRTPVHYMLGAMINASGDSLKSAETTLSSKVKGKQDDSFGEGLEDGMRVAFGWMDDPRAAAVSAEVHWAPSESRSESEFVDSLVKRLSLGVPKEQLWADYGYSPQQITQFKTMLQDEAKRLGVFSIGGPDIPPENPPPPVPVPADAG
jgi:hypothetical protein